ncbi:MAG: radical SAM protein [Candidatus Omnitrophica bacterium]|nr:radical SAM protein [Candidatus Omnitrophota bacterium]
MKKEFPKLLIADVNGKTYDVPYLEACGMKALSFFRLSPEDLIPLPPDSELFMLPGRMPVGYNSECGEFVVLERNPFFGKKESCYAVAAFLSPGFTSTYSASCVEEKGAKTLPLFSYASVAFYKEKFFATGLRIDKEKRQALSGMDIDKVRENVKLFRKYFPKNRLVRHLESCALIYGCPAAKNFFLKRYEAPLPTSPGCNAFCMGCLSLQTGEECSVTQPRIKFVPLPEEIAEVALSHIKSVPDPVVSFGQGCEGEPLMAGDVIEKAVKIIRKSTQKGMINLNTNASKPDVVKKLFKAGLNSIRVSANSVNEKYYSLYYRPRGYGLSDVMRSIKIAKDAGGFVSINYLVMPGFSDWKIEADLFRRFIEKTSVDMIQWRNLNYDPVRYFAKLKIKVDPQEMLGLDEHIESIKKDFPRLMHGYFNPSRGKIRRWERS